ncbi:MAG: NUDIX hydrolase [Pyramidobacter sp.]|nr:NUDIX hydrolase [Pyramidobacter sp.]
MERRLSSKRVYEGRILNLRVDEIEVSRNGNHARREVVEHGSAVAILARDGQGKLLFVKQFRYPLGAELLEIPAGLMEAGEDPREAAQRELREETGYRAKTWTALPPIWTTPGFCDEMIHLFFVEDLEWAPLEQDEDEDISLARMSENEARALFDSQQAQDAKTMCALAWYFARKA